MSASQLPFQVWLRTVAPLLLAAPTDAASHASYVERMFTEYIGARYEEPQRRYHTLQHLTTMLRETDGFVAFSRQQHSGTEASKDGCDLGVSNFVRPTTDALAAAMKEALSDAQVDPLLTPDSVLQLVLHLSIFFHDAVYDPTAKDNEAQSVALLHRFLREARDKACPTCTDSKGNERVFTSVSSTDSIDVPPPCAHVRGLWTRPALAVAVAKEVAQAIMATTHHFTVPPLRPMTLPSEVQASLFSSTDSNEPLQQATDATCYGYYSLGERVPTELLLLDVDLAILGSAPAVYEAYTQQIRQEYIHFADADFYAGRGAFLASAMGSFAKKPENSVDKGEGADSTARAATMQLYKTPYFFHRFEAQAWRNMSRELTRVEEKQRQLSAEHP